MTIDSLHVFISIKNGNEGVMVFTDATGKSRPMIASEEKEVLRLREVAAKIAKKAGVKVKHVHFTSREVIEDL